MAAGRPQKPKAQKVYEGTYRAKAGEKDIETADAGELVTAIESPTGLCPVASELFQNYIRPLCAKGLVFTRDVTPLILQSYLIEAVVLAKKDMDESTTKQDRSRAIGDLTKAVQAFTADAYKYIVSPVERAHVALQIKNAKPAKSLAERMINAQKERTRITSDQKEETL
jgi:hypothetical protein